MFGKDFIYNDTFTPEWSREENPEFFNQPFPDILIDNACNGIAKYTPVPNIREEKDAKAPKEVPTILVSPNPPRSSPAKSPKTPPRSPASTEYDTAHSKEYQVDFVAFLKNTYDTTKGLGLHYSEDELRCLVALKVLSEVGFDWDEKAGERLQNLPPIVATSLCLQICIGKLRHKCTSKVLTSVATEISTPCKCNSVRGDHCRLGCIWEFIGVCNGCQWFHHLNGLWQAKFDGLLDAVSVLDVGGLILTDQQKILRKLGEQIDKQTITNVAGYFTKNLNEIRYKRKGKITNQ